MTKDKEWEFKVPEKEEEGKNKNKSEREELEIENIVKRIFKKWENQKVSRENTISLIKDVIKEVREEDEQK